jgi:hypothetical protein
MQVVDARNGLVGEGNDDVSFEQSSALRGAARFHRNDDHSGFAR